MKLNYFPDTDSLYIDLSHRPSVESQEVSEGVVLDYDSEGNLNHEPHSSGSESVSSLNNKLSPLNLFWIE